MRRLLRAVRRRLAHEWELLVEARSEALRARRAARELRSWGEF